LAPPGKFIDPVTGYGADVDQPTCNPIPYEITGGTDSHHVRVTIHRFGGEAITLLTYMDLSLICARKNLSLFPFTGMIALVPFH
jgi:hypothetical protein